MAPRRSRLQRLAGVFLPAESSLAAVAGIVLWLHHGAFRFPIGPAKECLLHLACAAFGLSLGDIAVVFSVYYLPNIVSALAAGVLASLFGRRRVLTAGCATLSLGAPAVGEGGTPLSSTVPVASQPEGFF